MACLGSARSAPQRSDPGRRPQCQRDLYRLLERLAGEGVAVVMVSTEVDEHIELMDRVHIFREGAVSSTLTRDYRNRQNLVAAFFGRVEEVR